MKRRLIFAGSTLLLATAIVIAQETLPSQPMPSPKNVTQQYSYAIGLDIGSSFHKDGVPLDAESLMAGLLDSLGGKKPKFDEATRTLAMRKLSEIKMEAIVVQNQKFLEENSKAEGVKTLPSGLQYKVLVSGDGPSPTKSDVVKVHYKGQLIDETVFDSSYARNEPAVFPVGGVIAGWTEALQKMKVGDKWQLVIPSKLAYGDSGAGRAVPPHATLVFEVELLEIKSQ